MIPANIKEMSRSRWKRASERRYTYINVDDEYFHGAVGLVILESKGEPYVVHYSDGREMRIVDDGFHWLQLAPESENWWLTAMYDENCNLVQFYFDVTLENHILPDGKSYMRDLYIDVVMYPNGEIIVLDRDELDEAFEKHDISRTEYDFALKTTDEIIERFSQNPEELINRCDKYLDMLK